MTQPAPDDAATSGKIVVRAWRDSAFKARLIANPRAVVKEAGMTVPDGETLEVVEDSDSHAHLVLPAKPSAELPDEALDATSGGACNRGNTNVLHCSKSDAVPG